MALETRMYEAAEMREFKLLIGGQLVSGDMVMPVTNPATGEVFAEAPRASQEQLDAAVEAARLAFPSWSSMPVDDRRDCLRRAADAVDGAAEELATLVVRENGMPIAEARIEVMVFSAKLRGAASRPIEARTIEVEPNWHVEEVVRPVGVVAAITAWNVPLILMGAKLAPALMIGNTVVAKPAPTTPLSALRIGELVADILPPGVLNVITDANDLGAALSSHPDVRLVSFTGSTATGAKVVASGAGTLKRYVLELGGNDPAIVFDDVDVAKVAPLLIASAFMNNGQACVATKRVYAHVAIINALCAELGRLVAGIKTGNGFEEGVVLGPLQNKAQYDRVKGLMEGVLRDGTIVGQGRVPDGGFFVAPTIVRDVAEHSPIVVEEQFGPILPVLPFEDVEDVIARANATHYGLAASVFSEDLARARAVAARIEAGTVTINKTIDFHDNKPFTGAKSSGFGLDSGDHAFSAYGQVHIVDAGAV
jgi:acyl-CoA reductase-like NAD-dependent aldehyde dehydrogenase